jgi:hypothetical protein
MSRQRILSLLALSFVILLARSAAATDPQGPVTTLSPPGATEKTAPAKLVFTYPCTFAYTDGKPYENRVMDWECDYMHASLKNADKAFAQLPTIEAQRAFLADAIANADEAHNKYILEVAAIVQKTDPAKLPATLTQQQRLIRIAALDVELSTGVLEAAHPFLWPAREATSYVAKTAGDWPESWMPYIQPILKRNAELQGMVSESEKKLIDKAAADLQTKVNAAAVAKVAKAKLPSDSAMRSLYDGSVDAPLPGEKTPPAVPAMTPGTTAPAPLKGAARTISDLKTQQPPIPSDQEARAQRNYFSRGIAAGYARLKDDVQIGEWHATGQTFTLGNPYSKAGLNFTQEGEACAVGAQTEALNARGKKVDVKALALEGLDKGYYVDYETATGSRQGGTPNAHLNSLMTDHGLKSKIINNATPEQLDQAIRATGDAIVSVKARLLWKDKSVPDTSLHAVYVTGEEVDESTGKIRGYYINDTGTGEAARFISASDFQKAWINTMVSFAP